MRDAVLEQFALEVLPFAIYERSSSRDRFCCDRRRHRRHVSEKAVPIRDATVERGSKKIAHL